VFRHSQVVDDLAIPALAQCGGWASRAELRQFIHDDRIDRAAADGSIQRVGRGRFTLSGFDKARGSASEMCAIVSHRSAALTHGWSVRSEPKNPELIVPRNRNVSHAKRRGLEIRWRDLSKEDIQEGHVTTPTRTVVDCAKDLPLPESLAIADSALRLGAVSAEELLEQVAQLPRSGRKRAELVLTQASVLAANPFESALRALTLEAVGPVFVPQVELLLDGAVIRPDLVSAASRIVVEADSHEFHTKRAQLVRDCWRYNELTLDGWLVLRFSWEHVMHEQEWVRSTVERAVVHRRTTGSSLRDLGRRRPVSAKLASR